MVNQYFDEKNKGLKVSIITVTYNSAATIKDALGSVASQSYSNIEHIIVDGVSKDNTLAIVNDYNHNKIVTSEDDRGIYDAMNKGVKLASGDIVGILNSDDFYTSNEVISKVVEAFHQQTCDLVYADINYVKRSEPDKLVRSWLSGQFYPRYFLDGYVPAHPTVFVKRRIALDFPYDLRFHLAADYDFLLRVFHHPGICIHYIPEKIINMRLGGATSKNWRNILVGNIEILRSWIINQRRLPFKTLLYLRPKNKIKQFV